MQIPDILTSFYKGQQNNPEDMLILCSVLAVAMNYYGDVSRANDYFELAKCISGKLLDCFDYRVGCGFLFLCYFSLCNGLSDLAKQYALIARNISQTVLKNTNCESDNLWINCNVALPLFDCSVSCPTLLNINKL